MGIFVENDINNKHRINLSAHAYNIIKNDINLYKFENGRENITNFLNTIILNYNDDFDQVLANEFKRDEDNIFKFINRKELKSLSPDSIKSLSKNLSIEAKDAVLQKFINYSKDNPISFRLNKKSLEVFTQLDDRIQFFGSFSLYVKAMLEHYARLTPAFREKVYYKEIVNTIEKNKDKCLRINYISDKEGVSGETAYYVKPYKLVPDYSGQSMLLFGLSTKVSNYDLNAKTMKPYPFKLSNIKSVFVNNTFSPFISKENKIELDNIISNLDKTFGTEEIIVKFTNVGLVRFKKVWHNRPTDFERNEDGTYTFHCSPTHALFYFWKLTDGVEILKPESLRKQIVEITKKMESIYQ